MNSRNKKKNITKDSKQIGQALFEFLFLFAISFSLSLLVRRIFVENISQRWKTMVVDIAKVPTTNEIPVVKFRGE